MKKMSVLTVLVLCAPLVFAQDLNEYFSKVDVLLAKYVKKGRVNYSGLVSNFSQIEDVYKLQCDIDLSNHSAMEKEAFYINAYNIVVLYQVTKYYDFNKKSPMGQSGFFDKFKHKIAGESMTLNYLEIKKLLMPYRDPRIHFVLACAAKSCPPLASYAYTPQKLNQQLDERTELSINDANWLRLNTNKKTVEISKIFDWYKKDFVVNGENSVLKFINKYRTSPIPASYAVVYYEYDWSLNEG